MPLQIRRGTNAERLLMAQPLAAGELLYVTDDQRLYIGNNTTLGGVQITGYNDENARDAVATMFTSTTHSGISFVYNDALDTLTATVNLNTISGVVTAGGFIGDIRGSVFADDSTVLVDGVAGVLRGTLLGNVTGSVVGDIQGSVFADDSTVLVDGVDGVLRGTLVGNLIGNVTGNIVTNHIVPITPSSIIIGDGLNSSWETLTVLSSNIEPGLKMFAQSGGSGGIIQCYSHNGTYTNPTGIIAGEKLGGISFGGIIYNEHSVADIAESLGSIIGKLSDGYIVGDGTTKKGVMQISIASGEDAFGDQTRKDFTFTPWGALEVPTLTVMPFANPTARDTALPVGIVIAGMIVFLTDSTGSGGPAKLQVNTNSTIIGWVDLH